MGKEKKKNEGITEKAVIVSQWTSMLGIIKAHVTKLGIKVTEINGQVPVKSRGDIVEDFIKILVVPRLCSFPCQQEELVSTWLGLIIFSCSTCTGTHSRRLKHVTEFIEWDRPERSKFTGLSLRGLWRKEFSNFRRRSWTLPTGY